MAVSAQRRYINISSREAPMTNRSMWTFEWDIAFSDGRRLEGARKKVRADKAMKDGIPMPANLSTITATLQEEALGSNSARHVREELGLEDGVQLDCRRGSQQAQTQAHKGLCA